MVEFVPVKAAIFPVPLAPKPIAVFEFVHVYVVPLTFKLLTNVTAVVVSPAQSD